MKLTAEKMRSLSDFFKSVHDSPSSQSRGHHAHFVLAITAGEVLLGMRGYKAISDWVQSLSPTVFARFGCYFSHRKDSVASESTIRNAIINIDPIDICRALQLFIANMPQSTRGW